MYGYESVDIVICGHEGNWWGGFFHGLGTGVDNVCNEIFLLTCWQTVLNEDGSTTLVDLQAVQQQAQAAASQREQDDTQYVMVETPAGYQYVAVVMPEDSQQSTTTSVELQSTWVIIDTHADKQHRIVTKNSIIRNL